MTAFCARAHTRNERFGRGDKTGSKSIAGRASVSQGRGRAEERRKKVPNERVLNGRFGNVPYQEHCFLTLFDTRHAGCQSEKKCARHSRKDWADAGVRQRAREKKCAPLDDVSTALSCWEMPTYIYIYIYLHCMYVYMAYWRMHSYVRRPIIPTVFGLRNIE